MSKNLQFFSGYFSLFFLLITTIVFGQNQLINISQNNVYYKPISNQEIKSANYIIVNSSENLAVGNVITTKLLNVDPLNTEAVVKSTNNLGLGFISTELDKNSIKWYFENKSGNQFSIYNAAKQQYLYNDVYDLWFLGTFLNYAFNSSFTNSDSYKWLVSINNIKSNVDRADVYMNFSSSVMSFGTSSNVILYKQLTLDKFDNFVTYNGQSTIFDELSELNGQVTYSTDTRVSGNVVANFAGVRGNNVTFTGTGEIKLKATVKHQFAGSTVAHIPDYTKIITVKVYDDYACFNEKFDTGNEQDSGGTNNETPATRPIENFPVWGGNVQLYKSGVRLGTSTNPKGYIVSKELTNISGTVTVEIDIRREPGTTNRKVRFGFVTLGRNNSPSYIRTNLRTDQNVTRNVNDKFETISYTFTNVPSNSRLMIDSDSNGYRMWIDNVRINCNLSPLTIWENQKWSNGEPSINRDAVIREVIDENVIARNLTFENVDKMFVNAGNFIRIGKSLKLNATELEFDKSAYLFLDENATIDGPIIYNANHEYYKYDTRMFSSPVQNQKVKGEDAFSNSKANIYVFKTYMKDGITNKEWANYQNQDFLKGIGVGIQRAEGNLYYSNKPAIEPSIFKGEFKGIPYNDNFIIDLNNQVQTGTTSTVIAGGAYSLGNPYTAPINITRFLSDNKNTIESLELWKNHVPYDYAINDYITSDFWIKCSLVGCNSGLNEDKIDVGKGFIVNLLSNNPSNNITFQHSQKAYELTGVSQNNKIQENKSRYILSLNHNGVQMNSTLIGYMDGSTNDFDQSYDVVSDINLANTLHVNNNKKYLSIDARSYPLDISDSVQLSINADKEGVYVLKLNEVDGDFSNGQEIYLIDNATNEVINLSEKLEYNFETKAGIIDNRFTILYKNTLRINDISNNDTFKVYKVGDEQYVTSSKNISGFKVYTLNGILVDEVVGINSNNIKLKKSYRNSLMIYNFYLLDGSMITKKILYK
ncbi:hypothetical protein [Faecalibacter rhinopitheci]|uniref:Uncharacterized protein n=1 Tax=Faecalibacter rhinopitheci TaxID=2779678 RepID=A0A8J7K525_9FLAO|nr:hypothetical protein [Faecalibacter rhinopitheci]MBF0598103.1 hypothetical protein [Faecalibacter rhinopitheci]